jgi:hypothetical protein
MNEDFAQPSPGAAPGSTRCPPPHPKAPTGSSAEAMFQQFQRHIAQAVTELMKKVGGGHERELRHLKREVRAERACVRACAGVGAMAGLCGASFPSWGVLRTSVLRSRHAHAAQTARATARQLVQ